MKYKLVPRLDFDKNGNPSKTFSEGGSSLLCPCGRMFPVEVADEIRGMYRLGGPCAFEAISWKVRFETVSPKEKPYCILPCGCG